MNDQTRNLGQLSVPLLDLKAQFATIRAEVMPLIDQVCTSQMFILGEHVRSFEQQVAAYCGARHAVGMSSGTDALLAALMALGIGAGDEVLTTPYTFFATAGTIARVGARPLFCDIDPQTFNLSASLVREFIERHCDLRGGKLINTLTGGKVAALMPVHLYGQSVEMEPLIGLARRFSLKIIEDAAQAIGTEYLHGARVGALGDIGCFSFFPSKNLGAFGDGGLCTINDPELAERLRVLRVHGSSPKYYHAVIGGNFRLDEIQAAVLRVKLKHLDAWTEARRANAAVYDEAFSRAGLGERLVTPHAVPGCRHIYNQYVIRAERRDALRAFLAERRVGTEIYYPVPLHLQACFAHLGGRSGDFPQAERAAAESLALPIYPELSEEQLQYVVATIAEFYS